MTEENKVVGEKPVPMPLSPPQFSYALVLNTSIDGKGPATIYLTHSIVGSICDH